MVLFSQRNHPDISSGKVESVFREAGTLLAIVRLCMQPCIFYSYLFTVY